MVREQQDINDVVDVDHAGALVHTIAALAAAQMQADWSGMSSILSDVDPDDLPLFGNVAAEMLAQCAHWNASTLDDGGEFDSVPRPMRAAAIAISEGNYDRAHVMARGRCTPAEAAWVMCQAWNAVTGDPSEALARAQSVCRSATKGVRLIATHV